MPSGSTLSPLNSNPSSLRKYVTVTFLTCNSIVIPAEGKTRVCDIEDQVINYLLRIGMKDFDLFGLAIKCDNVYLFLEGEGKLNKYASRQWRSSPNGLDNVGNPLLKFEFRVKYYFDSHLCTRDHVSRLHYYLQLRQNLLSYGQVYQEELALGLASLALQADLGDFDPNNNRGQYFDPSSYIPQNMVEQLGVSYFVDRLPGFHRKHEGLSEEEAQQHFIRTASQSASPHNQHLYYLRRKKNDPLTQFALSVCDRGLGIYEEDLCQGSFRRKLVQSLSWSNIEDLSFDKKKFEIRSPCAGKLTFYASNDEISKHLLHLCRSTHQFSRNLKLRAAEHLRTSNRDRKSSRNFLHYGESSGYQMTSMSRSICQDVSHEDSLSISLASCSHLDSGMHRISICSDASSNTTSGVVSDRLISTDGSQDLEKEIGCLGSSTVHSMESGVASMTRSLSAASSTATGSFEPDENLTCKLHYTPPPSPTLHSSAWEVLPKREESADFGRTGSVHSSSSQHSASTVRSRYSLVPSRNRHELALGAQLADLSLAPELPDLADLPSMAATGEDVTDIVHHAHSTSHNCCSTCCDEEASDDEEREKDDCGSCSVCLEEGGGETRDAENGSFLVYTNCEEASNAIFHPRDDDSMMAQRGLDSSYNFIEEDYSHPNDFAQFYKGGQRFYECPPPLHSMQGLDVVDGNGNGNSKEEREKRPTTRDVGRASPVEEERPLDYSVESAQTSFLTWHLHEAQPSSLLSTASEFNFPTSSLESNKSSLSYNGMSSSRSEAQAKSSQTEAQAKFITSKPRITVLKAQTQLASTTAPSFSSMPLTRAEKCDFLSPLQRANSCSTDASLPGASQINPAPVIRANNYLDVHASSNLTKERLRAHSTEQFLSKVPRSLYLKNQKKRLNQQTLQDKHKSAQLHQRLLSDTVYQPAAYAQGVGVPLFPLPTYTGCRQFSDQKHRHHRSCCGQCISLMQQPEVPMSCHLQPPCCSLQSKNAAVDMLCPSQIKSFFQNPPPPSPHVGYGIGACPTPHELPSSAYRCANSDLGTYHPSLATVYTKQVSLSQIEQFKAQLNSDEDYVIYPHKDPALSRQEYMDAKQSQVIAAQIQKRYPRFQTQVPQHYRIPKSAPLYRSTPNVAAGGVLSSYPSFQSLASQQQGSSSGYSSIARGRCFSQQSLTSSFSSAPSASTQSLTGSFDPYSLTGSFDPYSESPSMLKSSPAVMRVRSDESILSSSGLAETESLSSRFLVALPTKTQPPKPPPYRPKEYSNSIALAASRDPSRPRVTLQQVRECGHELGVPLLAAICSDASFFSQESYAPSTTKAPKRGAFVFDSPKISAAKHSPSPESTLKYSLSGIYTTNQVRGPHVREKSLVPAKTGIHHHPKTQNFKTKDLQRSKLKHARGLSLKGATDNPNTMCLGKMDCDDR